MEIKVTRHNPEDTAKTAKGGDLAGFGFNGAAYCPECAKKEGICDDKYQPAIATHEEPHQGFGSFEIWTRTETDYPGNSCTVCHEILDTRLLVYKDGPGFEEYQEL